MPPKMPPNHRELDGIRRYEGVFDALETADFLTVAYRTISDRVGFSCFEDQPHHRARFPSTGEYTIGNAD